jgi:hypothetical protein
MPHDDQSIESTHQSIESDIKALKVDRRSCRHRDQPGPAGTQWVSWVSSCTSLTSKHLKRYQSIETPSVMHANFASMVDPPEYFTLNIKMPQISCFILHLLD